MPRRRSRPAGEPPSRICGSWPSPSNRRWRAGGLSDPGAPDARRACWSRPRGDLPVRAIPSCDRPHHADGCQREEEVAMDRLLALSNELAAAVEHAGRAVFAVHARPRLPSTGVHWRSGFVVTANHTVHADEGLTLTRPDGQSVAATLVGRDPGRDLAVLRVEAPDVPVAELGDSAAIHVGHVVLALGAGPRASWGVVSAIGAAGGRSTDGDV